MKWLTAWQMLNHIAAAAFYKRKTFDHSLEGFRPKNPSYNGKIIALPRVANFFNMNALRFLLLI